MPSNTLFEYACIFLLLHLVVKIHSQSIQIPEIANYSVGNQTTGSIQKSPNCNCIPVRRCYTLRNRRDWRTAGETCGEHAKTIPYRRVCCPEESTTRRPPRRPPIGNNDCGLSKENMRYIPIMPQENATEGQFPWMVAITYRQSGGIFSPWCSGFLIDERHVISVAHCYDQSRDMEHYRARIGNVNQNLADEYRIYRIIVPAHYKRNGFYGNIAILTLDRDVKFPGFNPICLPDEKLRRRNLDNLRTSVAAWKEDIPRGDRKIILKHISALPVISNIECERKLRQTLRERFRLEFPRGLSTDFLCTSRREDDGRCVGDSGGPLMFREKNRYFAVGVVAFNYRCGSPRGMPAGYTNVTHYLDWIKKYTMETPENE